MEKRGSATPQNTVWLSPSQFQDRSQKNPTAVRNNLIAKTFVCDEIKSLGDADRRIQFRISTGTPDRDRDVIRPSGWKVEDFKKNPVVLFAHDYHSLPVAKAIDVWSDDNGLSAVAEFPTKDVYPFADTVYQMLKAGFLNATSVGFKPLEWTYNEDRKGMDFMSQALLEFSIVPIPANAECLVEARSLGIDVDQLKGWAEQTLDLWNKADLLYVPRDQAEALYRIAGNVVTSTIEPQTLDIDSADGQQDAPEGEQASLGNEATTQPIDSEPVGKRGRVLSAANEEKLRRALTAIGEVLALLDAGKPDDDEEPEEDAMLDIANKAQEGGIDLQDDTPIELPEPDTLRIDINPDELRAALARTLVESTASLGPLIGRHVESAIRRARGRVD